MTSSVTHTWPQRRRAFSGTSTRITGAPSTPARAGPALGAPAAALADHPQHCAEAGPCHGRERVETACRTPPDYRGREGASDRSRVLTAATCLYRWIFTKYTTQSPQAEDKIVCTDFGNAVLSATRGTAPYLPAARVCPLLPADYRGRLKTAGESAWKALVRGIFMWRGHGLKKGMQRGRSRLSMGW